MTQPRKPPPTPVTERLKAERIQALLRELPELRLVGYHFAAGAVTLTLTTSRKAPALSKQDLDLAEALEKVA